MLKRNIIHTLIWVGAFDFIGGLVWLKQALQSWNEILRCAPTILWVLFAAACFLVGINSYLQDTHDW